jgi:disulfide bond formation protein DsbB
LIYQQPLARCDQIGWRIMGISATIWNAVWYVFFTLLWGVGLSNRGVP